MNTFSFSKKTRGFSMIEVLISVVVLGFGLLALAAIQTTIIRASSETKAQSVALQLAKDKIEDLRSFQTLAGYQAITSGTDCNVATNDTTDCIIGGVNYTRTTTVTRWAYKPSTSSFVSVTPLTGATPTGGSPAIYTDDNEYKRVLVSVTWADANGVTQSIGLEDGLGAISPGDSSKVTLNSSSSGQARKPKVFIYDPGSIGGVIPIAIGDGSSTAASNPVPVFTGSSSAVAETLFEVLTYAGTNGSVVAQSRVETAVVGCTCSTANAPSGYGYRPTYWNGYRYSQPTVTTDAPTAGWTKPGGNNTAESDRCISCCRDHRDPVGITGAKFDPWRTTHDHYLRSNSTTLTIAPTGTYSEACRLIRVDGFFRVASDFKNDYFGFLQVNNNGDINNTNQNLRAYAPKVDTTDETADSKKKYEKFILDYMDDRISNNTSYTYNTPLATSGYESTYDLNSPTTSGVAQPISLLATAVTLSSNSKWTHARGLYIDWIEPEALDIIKAANTNCLDKSTQLKRNTCVLPFVPFTSINLTELADFKTKLDILDATAVNAVQITAANNAFIDPSTGDANIPTRGNIYKGSAPTNNSRAFALSYMTASNSGITLKETIDPDEITLKDNQEYIISTSSGGGSGNTAVGFNVNLYTTATTTFPSTMSSTPKVLNYFTPFETCTTNSGTPASSNPQACSFAPDNSNDMNVKVIEYTKTDNILVTNGCAKLLNPNGSANTNAMTSMPVVYDYDVISGINFTTSAAGSITSNGGDNTNGDFTVLKFNSVATNDVLRIFFSAVERRCPSNYNQEANLIGNANPPDSLACSNGTNAKPTWSTTLKTCP